MREERSHKTLWIKWRQVLNFLSSADKFDGNTEIIGDISKGTPVLSPARRDLADGARIRIDNSLTRAVEPAAASEPADQPGAPPEATVVASVTTAPSDPDDAVISAAMTAHIDSVVSDARRNFISNSR